VTISGLPGYRQFHVFTARPVRLLRVRMSKCFGNPPQQKLQNGIANLNTLFSPVLLKIERMRERLKTHRLTTGKSATLLRVDMRTPTHITFGQDGRDPFPLHPEDVEEEVVPEGLGMADLVGVTGVVGGKGGGAGAQFIVGQGHA
jgi:hypothetical protein